MDSYAEEMKILKYRILELEKKKKKNDDFNKKTSIEHNFTVINEVLIDKVNDINNNSYSKSVPLARYYDQELVTRLDAIYNILQIIDERVKKLEDK